MNNFFGEDYSEYFINYDDMVIIPEGSIGQLEGDKFIFENIKKVDKSELVVGLLEDDDEFESIELSEAIELKKNFIPKGVYDTRLEDDEIEDYFVPYK